MLKYITMILMLLSFTAYGSIEKLDREAERAPLFGKAQAIKKDFENGKMAQLADKAIDNILRSAIKELEDRGHYLDAAVIESEWMNEYQGFAMEIAKMPGRDVGDHPAIQWLLNVHDKLHAILGDEVCHMTRIHNLWNYAYDIPVVFKCVDKVNINAAEYEKHFELFIGDTSYWVSAGVCVAFTIGSGVGPICGVIGGTVENMVKRLISPILAPKFYQHVCVNHLSVSSY